MKKVLTTLLAAVLVSGLMTDAAHALRFGGARSTSIRRIAPTPRRALAPAAAPARPASSAAAQPQRPVTNRWAGPVASLAAAVGLGWLLNQGGLAAFGGFALMVLLAIAALTLLSRVLARREAAIHKMSYGGSVRETHVHRATVKEDLNRSCHAGGNTPPGAAHRDALPFDPQRH